MFEKQELYLDDVSMVGIAIILQVYKKLSTYLLTNNWDFQTLSFCFYKVLTLCAVRYTSHQVYKLSVLACKTNKLGLSMLSFYIYKVVHCVLSDKRLGS